jgi:hypothetical protein
VNEEKDPLVTASARRHGVRDVDMLHAFHRPVRTFLMEEGMTMVIGSNLNGSELLEIGVVEARDESGLVIVHAMPARAEFLKRR